MRCQLSYFIALGISRRILLHSVIFLSHPSYQIQTDPSTTNGKRRYPRRDVKQQKESLAETETDDEEEEEADKEADAKAGGKRGRGGARKDDEVDYDADDDGGDYGEEEEGVNKTVKSTKSRAKANPAAKKSKTNAGSAIPTSSKGKGRSDSMTTDTAPSSSDDDEEEDGEDGDVGPPKETAPAPKKASPKKANKTSAASKVTPKPTTGGRSRISRENAAKAFDRYGNSTDDLKTYYEAAFEEPLKPGHYMTNYEIRALLWEHEYDPRKSN